LPVARTSNGAKVAIARRSVMEDDDAATTRRERARSIVMNERTSAGVEWSGLVERCRECRERDRRQQQQAAAKRMMSRERSNQRRSLLSLALSARPLRSRCLLPSSSGLRSNPLSFTLECKPASPRSCNQLVLERVALHMADGLPGPVNGGSSPEVRFGQRTQLIPRVRWREEYTGNLPHGAWNPIHKSQRVPAFSRS